MAMKKTHPAQFKPGQSGNPSGKPKGTRSHATRALLQMMEGDAQEITQAVIDAAKGGDMGAARFVIDRIVPAARERTINLDLPSVSTPNDAATAQARILQAVADGEVTPGEGNTLSGIVEARRKALETEELERRITALEARK